MKEYTTINGKSSYKLYRIYDYKKGDIIHVKLDDGTELDLEVAFVTDKRPMGFESTYSANGFFLLSDEFLDKYSANLSNSIALFVDSNNPDTLEEYINKNYNSSLSVQNITDAVRQENAMWLVISIFLYGFITVISLIGVTNIFNTITTNMWLRQKEFANLKSIGMTKKEFNRMIRLESIFYGSKSLIIGIPIGIGLSYLLYKSFGINMSMSYSFPLTGIIISILAVSVLIGAIMKYSLNKINKQNIIETIRKDNI